MAWTVVVPLKPLPQAKSRLAEAVRDGWRPALALAFAQDTVRAALACGRVGGVVVITDDPHAARELAALGARIEPDTPHRSPDGLNAALAHGARTVRARLPRAPVATLNADLPALREAELDRVLANAERSARAFLPDAAGVGTTLLTAAAGVELAPAFGGPSRARHRASGAREITLTGVDSVRQDVDTGADLRAALRLGVGGYTARLLAEHCPVPPPTTAAEVSQTPGVPGPLPG
ncbi:2-phospho-L-lactate guanylyltransferase [Streptomyces palmae]|uniref:Phosphoenolpyruvate guanylyltransferase n=1 Tax=Streptomyces palmae TaxID=1701085 RepID=A0A4Z0HAZ0_9ACTN|nr:2-phospho-L-lactate guanylyltransferase [Streptomyces palmae]TGB15750.1 2-phospho-L-lactate guanylyltransferase [Streptomyces palmae]